MTRNEYVNSNLDLVYYVAHQLRVGKDEDACQAGMYGLILAAERFDESKGFEFSTYACKYIRGYILSHLNTNKMIRPTREGNGWAKDMFVDSLDRNLSPNGDDSITLGDVIPVYDDYKIEEKEAILAVSKLDELQRKVWDMALSGTTQCAIADSLGKSQTTVSRILQKSAMIVRREIDGNR